MTIRKFRKNPVVVEAAQWNPNDPTQVGAIIGWLITSGCDFHHPSGAGSTTTLAIRTLEGDMTAQPGDWIIRGTRGEFYPCKPEPFADTFEPVTTKPDESGTQGGPWTRHGHPVRGVTVYGESRPPIARCGGPGMCRKCAEDAERIRDEATR